MSEEFEPLTPDELRNIAALFPEMDGVTMWYRKLECEYCFSDFRDWTAIAILQQRYKLHLMCPACWKSFLDNSSPPPTTE